MNHNILDFDRGRCCEINPIITMDDLPMKGPHLHRLPMSRLLCLILAASVNPTPDEPTGAVPLSNEIFIVANRDDALEVEKRFTQTMTDTCSNFTCNMSRGVGLDETQPLKAVIIALGDDCKNWKSHPVCLGPTQIRRVGKKKLLAC